MASVRAYIVDRYSLIAHRVKSSDKLQSELHLFRQSGSHPRAKNIFVWALVTSGSVGETTVCFSNHFLATLTVP